MARPKKTATKTAKVEKPASELKLVRQGQKIYDKLAEYGTELVQELNSGDETFKKAYKYAQKFIAAYEKKHEHDTKHSLKPKHYRKHS